MGSFRVLVERQRADPIATEFLSVASSAIRLRALRFSPLLPITIAPHHHENVPFRAARHLRYVRFGSCVTRIAGPKYWRSRSLGNRPWASGASSKNRRYTGTADLIRGYTIDGRLCG